MDLYNNKITRFITLYNINKDIDDSSYSDYFCDDIFNLNIFFVSYI